MFFFFAIGYVIEKKPLIGKGARWTKVVTLDATIHQYCIENLKESEFLFRIFAENSLGLSVPTNSEPITLKTHASELNLYHIYIYNCLYLHTHTHTHTLINYYITVNRMI